MCALCLQDPCHPSCPNADEPKAVERCMECGRKIYKGEQVLFLGSGSLCMDCLEEKTQIEVVKLLGGDLVKM